MKYTDEDLLNYSDGTLSPERSQRLQDAAESDSELADALRALDASRLPYKSAYAQQPVPPVPEALRQQVTDWVSVSRSETPAAVTHNNKRVRWFATAACLLVSFCAGYLVSNLAERSSSSAVVGNFSATDIAWVERVTDYQTLYVANTVRHIKNGAEKAKALLAGITLETGMRTGIPDLSGTGYQFVRAQELGFEGETLVQLVYLKAGKAPLALCYMPSGSDNSTDVRVTRHNGLGVAHWNDTGQRFVIVADETPDELRRLYGAARAVWL